MKRFGAPLLLAWFVLLPVPRLGAQAPGANLQGKSGAGNSLFGVAQRDDGDHRDRDDHDRDRHELRITRAIYGAGRRAADVTAQVRAQVRDEQLNIAVNNRTMGGDPARNKPKTLTVWYTLDGHDAQVTLNENDVLRLPGGEDHGDRDDHGNRDDHDRGDNRGGRSDYRDDDHGYDQARVERVVIPRGAEIAVRTDERIDSRDVEPGQSFPAHIAEDIRDADGYIAIPRGSEARLFTRRLEGNGDITLDVESVWVGGKRYRVSTEGTELENHRDGLGANQRTGEFVGGGAAIGAIIGAIAGGGRGAAIGAVAGASAGAGTEIITQGREVRVPAESVIRFRLDRPLRLHVWQ
jgi:hypothetical protein